MAESKWMGRLEDRLGELAVRAHRRPAPFLIAAGLLTVVGLLGATRLQVSADLEKLLPQSFQSVKDLEPVKERFGGIGYVVVVGMGAEPEQLRRFADDYAQKIGQLPGIRYVEYKRQFKFLEERGLYYLDTPDVQEIHDRIKDYEKWARRQANPLFVKLDDEDSPSLDFSDIEAKYGKRSDQRLAGSSEYYLDEQKKMVVILAKPSSVAMDLSFSQKLIGDVQGFLDQEKANGSFDQYGPNFRVGLTGSFKYKFDQQKQISSDMTKASLLAAFILLAYLIFHFRSLVAVPLVLVPVGVGVAWTYGLTYLTFGSLNVITGFLGAILGGLGIEHGIHLLGRYEVLRSEGVSSEEATRESFRHTGASALVSAVVAALSFIAISYSEFRAFREFGVIAAIGMVVVLAAYFPVLPALWGLANRLGWKPSKTGAIAGSRSELSRLLPRFARPLTLALGALLAVLIYNVPAVRFDFDFHSLEDSSVTTTMPTPRSSSITRPT